MAFLPFVCCYLLLLFYSAARNILLDDECNGVVGDFSMSRLISASGVIGKTRSVFGPIKVNANLTTSLLQFSTHLLSFEHTTYDIRLTTY